MPPKRKSTRQYLKSNKRLRGMTFGQRSAASVASKSKFNRIMRSQGRKGEVKAVDWPYNGTVQPILVNALPQQTAQALNMISAGSSFYNRVGRRIEMKSLHLHGKIIPSVGAAANLNANSANTPEYVRVAIIYDRQTNGALPNPADIFQNTDQQGNQYNTVYSDVNLNYRERFLILMDERRVLPAVPPAGTTVIPQIGDNNGLTDGSFHINRFIKLKGLLTHYKADSSPAVVGDISTGGLFILVFGESSAGAPNTYQYEFFGTARLRFDDT